MQITEIDTLSKLQREARLSGDGDMAQVFADETQASYWQA